MPTRIRVFGAAVPEQWLTARWLLPLAGVLLTVLASVEWALAFDFSLGILYVFPVMVAAAALGRPQIVLLAMACALLRDQFHPPLPPIERALRFLMASLAYSGAGLLVNEMLRSRRAALSHYAQLRLERDLRRQAEEQLRILAESSPAAILTLDSQSRVLAANGAAHELLGYPEPGSLIGVDVSAALPIFSSALRVSPGARPIRTSAASWAHRGGEMFPITTWFSSYEIGGERRLAAIIVDNSEDFRERERENFRHLLDYNRVLAGAVSHEIRNMCSAIAVACSNLRRNPALSGDADFRALEALVEGLSRVASFDLRRQRSDGGQVETATVQSVLDQLAVVVKPDWEDIEGRIVWHVPEAPVEVRADAHGLLQVFLNLAQNSLRAVFNSAVRTLEIRVAAGPAQVSVSFADSGPGVAESERLFHPFRPGSDGSGLGLYISRALMRGFGGDLVYVPTPSGCRFDVLLAPAAPPPALPSPSPHVEESDPAHPALRS